MFFPFAKIFWFIAQPLNLAILALGLGFLLRWWGWRRLGGFAQAVALAVLVLAAWTSLGSMLLSPLESLHARPDPAPQAVDGIVVLGGGLEGGVNLARGGYELNSAGDRFVEAAILARRYPAARVLVTGGMGSLILHGEADGVTAPRLLEALGVPRDRLILESESRDTYENALNSRRLVAPAPGETWLLVTSALHMPRSMALFRKVGFPVVAWPTDYRTSGREGVGVFTDNPLDSLQNTSIGIREWIGLLAYWLVGRIDWPFPSAA